MAQDHGKITEIKHSVKSWPNSINSNGKEEIIHNRLKLVTIHRKKWNHYVYAQYETQITKSKKKKN